MNRLWRRAEEASPLERDLNPELLQSERTRAWVVLGVFAFFALVSAATAGAEALGVQVGPTLETAPPLRALALNALGMVLYEALVLYGLGWVGSRGLILPDPPRYANSLVEVSSTSLVLVLFAGRFEPAAALGSPVFMMYAVLIVLSTLRLSFSLSLFTGLAAAVEYLALTAYYLGPPPARPDPAWLQTLGFNVGRGVFLGVAGVTAGIVARQIRHRIDAAVRLMADRARIVSTFGQYLSPKVADRLLEARGEMPTELRPVTVMFLDIRGFTTFAEHRTPSEVVAYLNELFGFMIEVVGRHSGIINKFLGDGFMAVFGAPISEGNDSRNATAAALEILAELEGRNARSGSPPTRVGIGIHAGLAVVGSIGSADRKEFTVIGDVVNLASRVEQLNKQLDSSLLVTEPVYEAVRADHAGEELAPVTVRGRAEPVRLYRLA